MLQIRKTPAAAREAGINIHRLHSLLRYGKITPLPEKDSSGDFVWSDEDMVRLRRAIEETDGRAAKRRGPAQAVAV